MGIQILEQVNSEGIRVYLIYYGLTVRSIEIRDGLTVGALECMMGLQSGHWNTGWAYSRGIGSLGAYPLEYVMGLQSAHWNTGWAYSRGIGIRDGLTVGALEYLMGLQSGHWNIWMANSRGITLNTWLVIGKLVLCNMESQTNTHCSSGHSKSINV